MDKPERAELNLHTTASNFHSVITPAKAMEEAVKMGLRAVAFTDLASVQSFQAVAILHRMYQKQLKVIYGLQLTPDGTTVLAKNSAGMKALRKIVSAFSAPETVAQLIQQYRKDLLYGAGCCIPYAQLAKTAASYDYLTLLPQADKEEAGKIYALGKKLNIPVAAVGNCRYIYPADRICTEVIAYTRGNRQPDPCSRHLRTTEEMLQEFSWLGKEAACEVVVTAPNALADQIEHIDLTAEEFPAFTLPDARETVHKLCREKLATLYGTQPPAEVQSRLDKELDLLGDNASLYLLSHRLVKFLQEMGGITGCRGTIGSTLMAYLLEISDINPLPAHYHCPNCKHTEFSPGISGYDLPKKVCPHCGNPMTGDGHNIPFETCMSPHGTLMPDIDINTPSAMQDMALQFLSELLGKDRVAYAGTVHHLLQRSAASCVQNYFDMHDLECSLEEKSRITDTIIGCKISDGFMPFGIALLPEGMQWEDATPIRSLEPPVCGIDKVTHMDYHSISYALPKLDILSYSLYDRLLKLFAATGTKPADIDYHDPRVYQLFQQLDTCGIPEFSSAFCKGLLALLKDIRFSDLTRVCGMTHGTNVWLDNGEHLLREHSFRELIGDRDDIFLTLRKYGIDRETAYNIMTTVRKGKFRENTVQNSIWTALLAQAGVPDWYIASMKKILYLFPKAHAAHYTKLAVTAAWFKVYYPAQFYAVSLQDLYGESIPSCSNQALQQRLDTLGQTDPSNTREQEMLALLLEARHRGFQK